MFRPQQTIVPGGTPEQGGGNGVGGSGSAGLDKDWQMRRGFQAAMSLRSLAILYALDTGLALMSSTEQRHPYVVFAGNMALAVIVCGLLLYVASLVRRGKGMAGAVALMLFLFCQLVLAASLTLTGGYTAGTLLRVGHVLYAINVVVALALVLRVWLRSPAGTGRTRDVP